MMKKQVSARSEVSFIGGSYAQAPVALTSTTNFQNVTLTYATPGDLSAGDTVTVRIWRVYEAAGTLRVGTPGQAAGADSTSDLRVYSARFAYTVEW